MTESRCEHCGSDIPGSSRFCPECGTSLGGGRPAETAPEGPAGLWEVLKHRLQEAASPRYRILKLLGSGGMAGVYLGEEPRLARKVAIKVMAPSLMMDPRMVERFRQEARSTARLSHPHIITIHEIDEREGLHYFVMSFVEGPTLDEVLKEASAPLPVSTVRRWLFQVAGALNHAHRSGIVHRDVKPGNVLVDPDGNAVVTDFGIAKVADEPGLTRTGMLVGTPSYMSPEQCMGGEVAGAADQYALGALGYHLLTGRPPFTGPAMAVLQAHLSEIPRPISELRPDCPPALAEIVHRMLSKNPEDRWGSMAEVVGALEDASETAITSMEARPVSSPARTRDLVAGGAAASDAAASGRPGRAPSPLVLAGLGIPVLLMAAVLLLRGGGSDDAVTPETGPPASSIVQETPGPPASEGEAPLAGQNETAYEDPASVVDGVADPRTDADGGTSPATSASATRPAVEPTRTPAARAPASTGPTGAAAPPPGAPAPAPAAAPAAIEVMGPIPTGARIVALGNAGVIELAPGGAIELPPGRYLLEASAEGFQGDRREVELAEGERLRWTPVLAPVEVAAPAAFDVDEARDAAETALAALASAFRSRSMEQVLRQYPNAPEEWRERWEAVVVNTEQIRNLDVGILDVEHRQTGPDGAEVGFVLALDFVDFRNRANEQRHAFIASFRPGPGGWTLSNLRSAP